MSRQERLTPEIIDVYGMKTKVVQTKPMKFSLQTGLQILK